MFLFKILCLRKFKDIIIILFNFTGLFMIIYEQGYLELGWIFFWDLSRVKEIMVNVLLFYMRYKNEYFHFLWRSVTSITKCGTANYFLWLLINLGFNVLPNYSLTISINVITAIFLNVYNFYFFLFLSKLYRYDGRSFCIYFFL